MRRTPCDTYPGLRDGLTGDPCAGTVSASLTRNASGRSGDFCWFRCAVRFKPSARLLACLVLPVIEGGVSGSPTVIVELSVFFFLLQFCWFLFHVFWGIKVDNLCMSQWTDLFIITTCPLYVCFWFCLFDLMLVKSLGIFVIVVCMVFGFPLLFLVHLPLGI